MQETEQIISLYHTGFIVCLSLTFLFAALSVFFFFKFKIRNVFDFRTGRAEKRKIKQMEEENAKTGKLRQEDITPNTTSDLYRTPSGNIPPVIYSGAESAGQTSTETEAVPQGSAETELLHQTPETECGETTLLTETAPEEKAKPVFSGKFEVVKEQMWVHTNEII